MINYALSRDDSFGSRHSIDNLIFDYFYRGSLDLLEKSLIDIFSSFLPDWSVDTKFKTDLSACSKFGWFRSSIWGGGIYIRFGHYQEYDSIRKDWLVVPSLRVKFNPNKYFNSDLCKDLISFFNANCDSGILIGFDYAIDVSCFPQDIVVHSRKEPGLFKGTRYFGQRGKHGYLKIYDKKAESDLSDELTRVEWTFRFGKSICFDDVLFLTRGPLPLPDATELSSNSYRIAHILLALRSAGGDYMSEFHLLDFRMQEKLYPFVVGGFRKVVEDVSFLSELLSVYCDILSLSFHSEGSMAINIGSEVVLSDRASDSDSDSDSDVDSEYWEEVSLFSVED